MEVSKFTQAKFGHRTEFIPVVELRDFFQPEIDAELNILGMKKEDLTPQELEKLEKKIVGFKVRSLTGQEFGRCRKLASERKNIMACVEGLLSGIPDTIRKSIREFFQGGDEDITEEDALRLHLFQAAVIEPKLREDERLEVSLRLFRYFPIDLIYIANRIQTLTGLGHTLER